MMRFFLISHVNSDFSQGSWSSVEEEAGDLALGNMVWTGGLVFNRDLPGSGCPAYSVGQSRWKIGPSREREREKLAVFLR